MATHVVTDDALHTAAAEDYFTRADSRVLIGLRAALEILQLPTPEYALRRKPGPTPAKRVLQALHADHPQPRRTTPAPRKINASPEAIAAARIRSQPY